jgi:hypothetical protein
LIVVFLQQIWDDRLAQPVRQKLSDLDLMQMTEEEKRTFTREHKIKPGIQNGWLQLPGIELFLMFPKDELHQWLLGVFGDHIVPAVVYRYI